MKKAYDEIMEHIAVTQEMRQRVLANIAQEDVTPVPPKIVRLPPLKKYLSVAACFILLLAGAASLPRLLDRTQPEPPPVLTAPNIAQAASLSELSALVRFEVTTEFSLPFEPEETTYLSYWNEMAEVVYSGEACSAVYRQSMGSNDNAGDYNIYSDEVELTAGGRTVTLKGDNGIYVLAVWTDEAYSYSLSLSPGAERHIWQNSLAY